MSSDVLGGYLTALEKYTSNVKTTLQREQNIPDVASIGLVYDMLSIQKQMEAAARSDEYRYNPQKYPMFEIEKTSQQWTTENLIRISDVELVEQTRKIIKPPVKKVLSESTLDMLQKFAIQTKVLFPKSITDMTNEFTQTITRLGVQLTLDQITIVGMALVHLCYSMGILAAEREQLFQCIFTNYNMITKKTQGPESTLGKRDEPGPSTTIQMNPSKKPKVTFAGESVESVDISMSEKEHGPFCGSRSIRYSHKKGDADAHTQLSFELKFFETASTRKLHNPHIMAFFANHRTAVHHNEGASPLVDMYRQARGCMQKMDDRGVHFDLECVQEVTDDMHVCFCLFYELTTRKGHYEYEGIAHTTVADLKRGKPSHMLKGPVSSSFSYNPQTYHLDKPADYQVIGHICFGENTAAPPSMSRTELALPGGAETEHLRVKFIVETLDLQQKVFGNNLRGARFPDMSDAYQAYPCELLGIISALHMRPPEYPMPRLLRHIERVLRSKGFTGRSFSQMCSEISDESYKRDRQVQWKFVLVRQVIVSVFNIYSMLVYRDDFYDTLEQDSSRSKLLVGEGDCEDGSESIMNLIREFLSKWRPSGSSDGEIAATAIHKFISENYVVGMGTMYIKMSGSPLHSICVLAPKKKLLEARMVDEKPDAAGKSHLPVIPIESTNTRDIEVRGFSDYFESSSKTITNAARNTDYLGVVECVAVWKEIEGSSRGAGALAVKWRGSPPVDVKYDASEEDFYIGFLDFIGNVNGVNRMYLFSNPDYRTNLVHGPTYTSVLESNDNFVFIKAHSDADASSYDKAHEYISAFGTFPTPILSEEESIPDYVNEIKEKMITAAGQMAAREDPEIPQKHSMRTESVTISMNYTVIKTNTAGAVEKLKSIIKKAEGLIDRVKIEAVEIIPLNFAITVTFFVKKK